ncbi:XRE family transcriptional regulator [Edwardsiella piscicida]|uniref:Helix-turn-helix transcriptional regulator n=2 Tax=Edwardsiella piscicida TaxID=1263550 RepID=A0AAQ3H5A6_EDWPI|nr:helix-turn-helix transcriptional regulator [Edwardsiella piscicida]MDM3866403.1 helix-turn-helix transcriptional regulator [Edwardsiella piscicida]QHR94099.1 helix-turn-helix domain-containing protein [Edwardsiella piscicida]UJT83981.1 helix-turn-helix transcriptional regulator [Edwardsiella piscicida]UJT87252.1 helix-turn-helix transcriptional regulator [Edwardsiella piscicida]WDU92526.1 helix-turn-helix transcriptional regulator [Edwardsiella piscicida]
MNENTFADRLSLAMAEAKMTQASLAEAVGMAQPSVWKLTSGKAKSSRKVVEIAAVLGVQPEWLSSGRGPMRKDNGVVISSLPLPKDDSYIISVMDISYSCGPGSNNKDYPDIIRSISLEPDYARRVFGGRSSNVIRAINANGDSMKGTIDPEDLVFIDISVKYFDGDGVYAFTYGSTSHIKRLQMVKNTLTVISDNPAYANWSIEKGDEDQMHINGKVIINWPMRLVRFA